MSNLGNKEIMAKNILFYMNMHDKSRNDMCDALGVKYTTFTDWVKGKSYPRIDKIELMANYFGISKADLVEEHDTALGFQLSPSEQTHIHNYRLLDDIDKARIDERMDIMLEDDKYDVKKEYEAI